MVGMKALFEKLKQRWRSRRHEMSCTLIMRGHAARALKALCSNRRATSRGTMCLQEMKRRLLKKLTRKVRFMSSDQTLSLPYLPPSSSFPMWTRVTKRWPWIDCQRRSCLVLAKSSRPRVGHQRSPCLVSDDVATTSIWLSSTTMLGPCKVIITSSWPPKMPTLGLKWRGYDLDFALIDSYAWSPQSHHDLELATKCGHAWSQMTRLWPRFDSQWLSCLVPTRTSWPRVDHQRWSCLVSDDTTTTSIWLSSITMRGPKTIAMTLSRLSVIAVLGLTLATKLRPLVNCQKLQHLVLKWLAASS